MRNSKKDVPFVFDTPYYRKFKALQHLVFADSREVWLAYLNEYILYLKIELNKVTLLENPLEICSLCKEIMKVKKIISEADK